MEFIAGTTIPALSADLIAFLDKNYPHRCPSLSSQEREIWAYSGKRMLIDGLLSSIEQAKEMSETSDEAQNIAWEYT